MAFEQLLSVEVVQPIVREDEGRAVIIEAGGGRFLFADLMHANC